MFELSNFQKNKYSFKHISFWGQNMVGVPKRTISFYIHYTPSLKHVVET
jgi:hypothetical protein